MEVSTAQAFDVLCAAIPRGLPVLLVGAPGVGKSDIVAAACVAAGYEMVLSHPALADPTDAKGLPFAVDGKADFLPFGELLRVLDSTVPTVWLLDDLGQATPATQAAFMPWLLAREVNGHRLPDHVTIIGTTNGKSHRANVSGMLSTVKNRFTTILEIVPNLRDWLSNYAEQPSSKWFDDDGTPMTNVDLDVRAYLTLKPDALISDVADGMENNPSPRTWKNVSDVLRLGLSSNVLTAAICGAIGQPAGMEFASYLQLREQMLSVEDILAAPGSCRVPEKSSEQYLVAEGLSLMANANTIEDICSYLERWAHARGAEYPVVCLRGIQQNERKAALMEHPAWARMLTGALGTELLNA